MSDTTLIPRPDSMPPRDGVAPERLALVVVWDKRCPARAGELAWVEPGVTWTMGRTGGKKPHRLRFIRHRPGADEPGQPWTSPYLSRDQLLVTALGPDMLEVENIGRIRLRINGVPAPQARVRPGDVLELEGELVLLVHRRSPARPSGLSEPAAPMPFGEPDPEGMTGESFAMWELRRWIAAVAPFPGHVLVHGGSGTGKELVARAIHARSGRPGPLVTCNAAAIPAGVAEAEWFGNRRDYPNPGMPARRGLAGEAEGGTLFIDEIGELPPALQAHLLRLLDSGEVQRLGEPRPVRLDVRIVAATNRPLASPHLKSDVLARFVHRRELPGLSERLDDLPLLVRHLLRELLARRPERRALQEEGVRVKPRLWTALLRHRWTLGVRELQHVLSAAIVGGGGDWLDLTAELPLSPAPGEPILAAVQPHDITPEQIREALAATSGIKAQAARKLGLNSRHQLRRLMARYGMEG